MMRNTVIAPPTFVVGFSAVAPDAGGGAAAGGSSGANSRSSRFAHLVQVATAAAAKISGRTGVERSAI
jgi:hypothetical protein